ncbi:MAG: phage tail protein I [Chloroflexi bacterium]|nr:MAG: phage tail protein I [Chloroflexota bacterium]
MHFQHYRAKNPNGSSVGIDHVVNFYNRYPGETVTFYTRLTTYAPVQHLTLTLTLPAELTLKDYRPPKEYPTLMPSLDTDADHQYLRWPLSMSLPAHRQYEFQAEAVVARLDQDAVLTGEAQVADNRGRVLDAETVRISVLSRSKYLKYLPAIYQQDELMGRFLMLFESFWHPIDIQLEGLENYFDPKLTPPHFLPWLARWLNVDLDAHWSEHQQRQLLQWAMALHRHRGTRWGLVKALELYTGQQAEVVEQRSNNFVLGSEARLGPEIALGYGNIPHTFTVVLRVPPIQAETPEQQEQLEAIRRRAIEAIIDRQKPAHTVYHLHLETLPSSDIASPADVEPEPPPGHPPAGTDASAIWSNQEEL